MCDHPSVTEQSTYLFIGYINIDVGSTTLSIKALGRKKRKKQFHNDDHLSLFPDLHYW